MADKEGTPAGHVEPLLRLVEGGAVWIWKKRLLHGWLLLCGIQETESDLLPEGPGQDVIIGPFGQSKEDRKMAAPANAISIGVQPDTETVPKRMGGKGRAVGGTLLPSFAVPHEFGEVLHFPHQSPISADQFRRWRPSPFGSAGVIAGFLRASQLPFILETAALQRLHQGGLAVYLSTQRCHRQLQGFHTQQGSFCIQGRVILGSKGDSKV